MLHIPFLYKHVHALHHRNINVGPWSGLSMHPVEHIIYLGTILFTGGCGTHLCIFCLHAVLHFDHDITGICGTVNEG